MLIRAADPADLVPLHALRSYYVDHSYATFDETPLPLNATENWLSSFASVGPYRLFVAEQDGQLIGFAGSQRYRVHPAFCRTIETTVYVAPGMVGRRVGTSLYRELFESIATEGLHRAVVGIALPNDASVHLHKKLGFLEVGVFDEYASKNGEYISSLWMQRSL